MYSQSFTSSSETITTIKMQHISVTTKSPFAVHPSPFPWPLETTDLLSVTIVSSFLKMHINGTTQCITVFCV